MMKKLILILALWSFGGIIALPTEYFKSFDSAIVVNADGSMDVVETIVYVNQNIRGKQGIFRSFPTRYKGPGGTNYTVRFAVREILRNGKSEEYCVDDSHEGKNIRIGSPAVVVEPGLHTYVIHYHTDRQLGFLAEYDMLYWNVTGNGWPFFIEQATARVKLPEGIDANAIHTNGYTGAIGSYAKNFTQHVDSLGVAHFKTTRPIAPHEGLTVEVSWPKGFTQEPPSYQKNSRFYKRQP
jgi:hypothetical protein